MDQAQVQKALMKEIFMEKISEMLLSQNKNNKMMTNESYQNIIKDGTSYRDSSKY